MKKKMAIILSLVLALSCGSTAMAAGSPTISTGDTQGQITVTYSGPADQILADAALGQEAALITRVLIGSAAGEQAAFTSNSTFKDAAGKSVDPNWIKLVVDDATALQTQQAAARIVYALNSKVMSVLNGIYEADGKTKVKNVSVTDNDGLLNVVKTVYVSVQDQNGKILKPYGAVAFNLTEKEVMGDHKLRKGETLKAAVTLSNGKILIVEVKVIKGMVCTIGLPFDSVNDITEVSFIIAKEDVKLQSQSVVTAPNT